MTPSRTMRDKIMYYTRMLADSIGLRDWTLELLWDIQPISPTSYAAVDVIYGRKVARICFGEPFWSSTKAEQRDTLIHELIHCHLEQIARVARDMEEQLGSLVYSVFNDNHHHAVECATDALAASIAPRFPLPPVRFVKD